LERPVPAGLLEEVGPTAVRDYWRGALGRDMPPSVAAGATSATVSVTRNSANGEASAGPHLTPREREVLSLLARHYSNREIADELVLSTRTVERHVANIYAKLGVSSRRLATAYARDNGVFSGE
jgi:DNA-binding NarL/FixJ family response regulator